MLIAFVMLPLMLVAVMLLLPVDSAAWLKISIIFLLVLITGFLMGSLFALSGLLRKTSVITGAGQSFSADLLGSAIGILLVSVYMVPQLGLPITAIALAMMNLAGLGVAALKK
jgi:predicted membrane-bound spermidine synthase